MASKRNTSLALLALAIGAALTGSARAALVAEYGFEEGSGTTANDSTGNGNTGTLTEVGNSPLPSYSTNAAVGKYAISLAGNTSGSQYGNFVDLGDPADLQLTGAMTLSAEVDLSQYNPNGTHVISKMGFNGNRGWDLNISANGDLGLQVSGSSSSVTSLASTTVVPLNTYALITGVYDPTGASDGGTPGLYVYLNGAPAGSDTTSIPTSMNNSSTDVILGNEAVEPNSTGTPWFFGLMDDVRIYNNALSPAQVAGLVPEPTSLALVGMGAIGLVGRRRKRSAAGRDVASA